MQNLTSKAMHNFQIDRGLCLNQSYQQIFCVPILFPHVMCGKVKFRCIKYFSIYFDREKTQNNIRNTKILNFYLFIYICRQTDKHKIYQNLIWLGQMEKYIFRLFFLVFFCHHLPYLWPMCECVKGMNGKMIGRNMQIDWTMFVTRHTNSCFVAVGIIHELMHDISVMCFEKDINIFFCFSYSVVGEAWIWREKRRIKDKSQAQQTPAHPFNRLNLNSIYVYDLSLRYLAIGIWIHIVHVCSVVWGLSFSSTIQFTRVYVWIVFHLCSFIPSH